MQTKEDENNGLTSTEVGLRLKKYGLNELPTSKPKSVWIIAYGTIREPMFLLLLACSLLYLFLGDLGDALILSTAIFFVMAITFIQEKRTERTLESLRELSSPRALVIRNGVPIRIPGRDVVPGDIVIISDGDRVPADGFVLKSQSLRVNESLLTGESVPVGKTNWNGIDTFDQTRGDDTAFVYSGTLVVQGSGSFKVHCTGTSTAIGKIGASLKKTHRPPSALQKETRFVVRNVAISSLLISVAIAIFWWHRNDEIIRGILMGLTFAMSTIPEEFPVVLTVFMALGAWRISKKNVLTRQMNSIEALGSATFLCVDKTGTLTENRMTISSLWHPKFSFAKADFSMSAYADDVKNLVQSAALASDHSSTDPMDSASVNLAKHLNSSFFNNMDLKKSYPLVRPLLAVGYAWHFKNEDKIEIYGKGAPEDILRLCHATPSVEKEVMDAVKEMASQGQRVLAVAKADQTGPVLFNELPKYHFTFLGLVGYCDPVKAGVPEAVKTCHDGGIKVMMITGDYPTTASSVAREIGLENWSEVLSGEQLTTMNDAELAQILYRVRVLARMVPEQKLRIVNTLKALGEIVAMTGDGVNDSPALKAAHIGIAMGQRGTDVAREAAALVLLKDDFTSIVDAILLGRRIYDNIQKAVSYIIAIHLPIIGLTLIPLALGMPPILWPVHLAFLELIIDPVCSIAFESEPSEESIMKRPPRPLASRLFGRDVLVTGIMRGIFVLIAVLSVYVTVGKMGNEPNHARAISFATLIFANIGLILALRSRTEPAWEFLRRSNPTLGWIVVALLTGSGVVLFIPKIVDIFHFSPPHLADLGICALAAMSSLIGFEFFKIYRRKESIQRL